MIQEDFFNVPISRRAALFGLPAFALVWFAAGCGSGGNNGGNPTTNPTPTGTVLSRSVTTIYTRAQLNNVIALSGVTGVPPAANDVQMVELTYLSTGTDGANTTVSGLLALPTTQGAADAPLLVYHHGTTFERNNVPSNPSSYEALALAALFASQGYVVAAPDYVGLGKSTGKQTFEYAAGLVPTSLDMVRAARSAAPLQGIRLSSKLFLTGYSEGGYAALAVQRAMQQLSGEFNVTASAPMAGPYDLSGTTFGAFFTNPGPHDTAFAAGILTQQNAVGHFYTRESDVFVPPYDDGRVSALFDGLHTDDAIIAALPATPAQLLTPAFAQAVQQDPNHPVNVYLRANDVYDFTPLAPTRFFHGGGDTTIPIANAQVAVARMQARGAQNVSLVNVGDTLDHSTATVPSFLGAKAFFDGFR